MGKCIELMTKDPVFCLPTENVEVAARHMKAQDVGSIPVIEDKSTMKLLGIVT